MLFKFQKIVGCIEPWVKNRDTNRIVSLCIVTALSVSQQGVDWDPSNVSDRRPKTQFKEPILCFALGPAEPLGQIGSI